MYYLIWFFFVGINFCVFILKRKSVCCDLLFVVELMKILIVSVYFVYKLIVYLIKLLNVEKFSNIVYVLI